MITIVNTTAVDGVLSSAPFSLTAPTTAGNALIFGVSVAIAGSVISSITTDAGDSVPGLPFSTDTNAAYNTSGAELTTAIFWVPSGKGGATQVIADVASGSFSCWVWEVHSNGLSLDAASFNDSTISGQGSTATGPTLAGTGTSELYVACMTQGAIVSLASPWTLDPTSPVSVVLNFGGGHLISTGSRTPIFTQTSTGRWSVSGVAFKESASSAIPNTLTGGPFQKPDGTPIAHGTLLLELSHDENYVTGKNQIVAGLKFTVPLDANGYVLGTPTIWPNSAITPANSTYTLKVFDQTGARAWLGPHTLTVSSSPSPFPITTGIDLTR